MVERCAATGLRVGNRTTITLAPRSAYNPDARKVACTTG